MMRSLVGGIDRTLREVGQTVKTVSGVAMPFDGMLDDNEDIRDVLEYISESLTRSTLTTRSERRAPGVGPAGAGRAPARRAPPGRPTQRPARGALLPGRAPPPGPRRLRGLSYDARTTVCHRRGAAQRDLQELTDLLAIRLYQKLGQRAYRLTRQDVADLVDLYVSDLVREDREMIPWLVWDLLQEGMEIEYERR